MKRIVLAALTVMLAASCTPKNSEPVYKDANAPIEDRVNDLLDRMTVDEMIAQMNLIPHWAHIDSNVRAAIRADKVGAILKSSGCELNRSLQEEALKASRLGIPLMFHEDVIHGFRTIFPIPLAEACSWDPEQIEKNSAIIAKESAAAGLQLTYAPMVDVSTDGRWGRIMETSGEDPYLSGVLSAARVRGFQGDDMSSPETIMACVKHFAGYAKLGAGRDYLNCEFTIRELEETYLPPYRACIEAGVGALMESYTMYDGVPVSYSKFLLNDVLRDELGYEGLLMTDWKTMFYAIKEGAESSEEESVRKAISAGIDMDMTSEYVVNHLKTLYDRGDISYERIRNAAYHCLKVKFQVGLFDDPFRYFDEEREKEVILCDEIRATAREAARGSMVLLKNNGVLPLAEGSKVAVCGPMASKGEDYLGAWSAKGRPEEVVTVAEAVKGVFKVSESASVAIVCIGEPKGIIGEGVSTGKLELSEDQIALLKRLKSSGKKVVAVLFSGRPLVTRPILDNCDALLEAWYPGTEGGNAVVDILSGKYNPSARLVQTFPKHVGQVPIQYNPLRTFGYVYHCDLGSEPEFPFGFGLSYTTYEYGAPKCNIESAPIGTPVEVSIDVTNTGKVEGVETVQLYVSDLVASVIPREQTLRSFQRVRLAPGETKTVTFTLQSKDFEIYSADHKWVVEPGEFDLKIGPASNNTQSVRLRLD